MGCDLVPDENFPIFFCFLLCVGEWKMEERMVTASALAGTLELGGHRVEVTFEEAKQRFVFNIHLSSGARVYGCVGATRKSWQERESKEQTKKRSREGRLKENCHCANKSDSDDHEEAEEAEEEDEEGGDKDATEQDDDAGEPAKKRAKIEKDEKEEEERVSIQEALHPEMISMILRQLTHRSIAMWVVCRTVCRAWKDAVLDLRRFKKRISKIWKAREYRVIKPYRLKKPAPFFDEVAAKGWMSLLIWGHKYQPQIARWLSPMAAQKGRFEMLEYYCSTFAQHGPPSFHSAAEAAARGGHLEVLKWLKERNMPLWPDAVMAQAAGRGHLEVAKWLKEEGGSSIWNQPTLHAVQGGHLKVLKWLQEIDKLHLNPSERGACLYAAMHGHLEVLQWLRENGFNWNGYNNNISDPHLCLMAAACGGHINVMQWMKETGVPWEDESGSFGSYPMTCAAWGGHLDAVKWLREKGCPWDGLAPAFAASKGHSEVLKWLKENGCPWNQTTCEYAAGGKHVELLRWARENGCPWDMRSASGNPHFDLNSNSSERSINFGWHAVGYGYGMGMKVLKFAMENGGVWCPEVCSWAANRGKLKSLQWARLNGCPWDSTTTLYAAGCKHWEILQWALEQGCPCDDKVGIFAVTEGNLDMLKWLQARGFLNPLVLFSVRRVARKKGHEHIFAWCDSLEIPDKKLNPPFVFYLNE